MSLASDMIAALEAVVRAAVPDMPAGALGVTHGWVSVDTLAREKCPHLIVFDPTERATQFAYKQTRVELGLRLHVVRNGSTFDDVLADWSAIRVGLEADRTLGGKVDFCELSLDALAESGDESPYRVAIITAAATVEL